MGSESSVVVVSGYGFSLSFCHYSSAEMITPETSFWALSFHLIYHSPVAILWNVCGNFDRALLSDLGFFGGFSH